jgi:hypothetical protein
VSGSRSGARGQSLTEFALLLPILIILVMAIFDFGRALFYMNTVSEAAKTGSRIAMVNQDGPFICKTVAEGAVGLNLPTDCVTVGTPGVTHQVAPECPALDCEQTVIVSFAFQPIMPVLGGLVGPVEVTSRSTVHVERVCPGPCPTAAP